MKIGSQVPLTETLPISDGVVATGIAADAVDGNELLVANSAAELALTGGLHMGTEGPWLFVIDAGLDLPHAVVGDEHFLLDELLESFQLVDDVLVLAFFFKTGHSLVDPVDQVVVRLGFQKLGL